jgi:NAD(P)-dependent dehydrogenase (short-subunit alcohol dehydrogenase family)
MKDTKEATERILKVVDRLDFLINNASAYFPQYRETSEGSESTLVLNCLSSLLLANYLIARMERTASEYGEARIINISSIMHKAPINWNDLNCRETTYDSSFAYYKSKHLLTSFTYYLDRKLRDTGITVNCIHPGFAKTALAQSDYPFSMNAIVPIVGFSIWESPEQAADTPVWLASSNKAKDISGEYIHHRRVKKSWSPTRGEDSQTRLYNVTQVC